MTILADLCRRKRYPDEWCKMPPRHDWEYSPYQPAYWEKEWDIFTPWIKLVWTMLKRQVPEELIWSIKTTMLERAESIQTGISRANITLITGCLTTWIWQASWTTYSAWYSLFLADQSIHLGFNEFVRRITKVNGKN
jgi:hypothetical protein